MLQYTHTGRGVGEGDGRGDGGGVGLVGVHANKQWIKGSLKDMKGILLPPFPLRCNHSLVPLSSWRHLLSSVLSTSIAPTPLCSCFGGMARDTQCLEIFQSTLTASIGHCLYMIGFPKVGLPLGISQDLFLTCRRKDRKEIPFKRCARTCEEIKTAYLPPSNIIIVPNPINTFKHPCYAPKPAGHNHDHHYHHYHHHHHYRPRPAGSQPRKTRLIRLSDSFSVCLSVSVSTCLLNGPPSKYDAPN